MRARHFVLASLVVLTFAAAANAQSITGTIRGTVKSADDGQPMAEAAITLVHEPTGNEKTTVTNASGEFAFTGLRVGGPYHLTAEFSGYRPHEVKGLILSANKVTEIDIPMHLAEEVIEVSSNPVPRNTSGRQVIGHEEIEALPSINRDPKDMVKRTPEVTVSGSSMSVGGMNPRFNSFTIDGLRMDDDFGLNSSGYPTNRSPIPLAAIEEMIVEQAPFDVRYDKFIGGNVNIITKSGTNDVHGELFFSYSDDHLLGHHTGSDNPADPTHLDLNSGSFQEFRYGAEIAGPIMKDKMHFMVALDGLADQIPVSVGPAGSGAAVTVPQVTQDEVNMAKMIAQQVYNFNAGDPSVNTNESNINAIAKLEYEIDQYNRIVANYIFNDGNQINQPSSRANPFTGLLPLSSQWFNAQSTLNSGSVRWFSDITDELSTEVSVSGKAVSNRVPPLNGNGFMAATIFVCNPTPPAGQPCPAGHSGQITLGPDDFRHSNELDNDLLQVRAAGNYLAGKHLLTGGLEYELLHIRNLFVPDSNGAFQYGNTARGTPYVDGLMAFMQQDPFQLTKYQTATACMDPNASADCINKAAAVFNTGTLSPFLQDQWKLTKALTVTFGVRMTLYKADQNIVDNPTFATRYSDQFGGLHNTGTLDGKFLVMPRLGVSWLATDRLNLRAGGGLYSGGTPTVWMSNNYTNDGVRIGLVTGDTNALDLQGFDGRNIPQSIKNQIKPGNGNVDSLDPNFHLPSAWKVGAGADWDTVLLGMLKLNYVYTQVQDGVFWVDLRRCNTGGLADMTGLNRSSNQQICTAVKNADGTNSYPNTAVFSPVAQGPDGRYIYDTANFPTFIGYDMMMSNNDGYGRHVGGYGHTASAMLSKSFNWGLFVAGSYAYENVMEVNPANSSISSSNYKFVDVFDPNYADLARSNYETTHRLTGTLQFSHPIISHFTSSGPWKYMKTSIGIFAETRSGQPFSWVFGDSSGGSTLAAMFGEDRSIASADRMLFYVPNRACINANFVGCSDVSLNGIDPQAFKQFLNDTGLINYAGSVAPRNAFTNPWISRWDMRISQDLPNPLGPRHRARFVMDITNLGNMLDHKWGRVSAVPFNQAVAVDVAADPSCAAGSGMPCKYVYSNLRSSNQNITDLFASVWKIAVGVVYDF